MKIVGLDFGTTNSIVSYYNNDTQNIEAWKIGGSDGSNYIPSCIAFDDSEVYIGDEAKYSLRQGNSEAYTNFKILLHENDSSKLSSYNYKNVSPREIAKKYIEKLLDCYKKEQRLSSIDSLVITIPEIWIQDDMLARNSVSEIAKELHLPLTKLVSEPVAAGAYFLDNYKKRNSRSYDGHLLVFDYGGGTLDITLLEAKNDAIQTLERTGKGQDYINIGKAGVAYDEYVVMSLFEKTFQKKLQKNSEEYYELLIDFEREKIANKNRIEKNIKRYEQNNKLNTEIFSLRCDSGKLSITPDILIECFNKLLRKDVISSLEEIEKYFYPRGIDINNHDAFRIIMVGGFSNYYLCEKTVRDFFNSKTDSDRRFETHFSLEDTTLAISKGAALIANEFIKLDETFPMSIGLVLYKIDNNAERVEVKDIVFKKGDNVTNEIVYSQYKVIGSGKLTLFFDNGRTSFKIKIDKNPQEIFPNFEDDNNNWKIGFSIDTNSFYYIHITDASGKTIITEIGNVIEEYKDSIIVESK